MDNRELIKDILKDRGRQVEKIAASDRLANTCSRVSELITEAFRKGKKVMFCGNGGSAADAQHLAAELAGRFYLDRKPLPAEALHVNTSYLTAVANDISFTEIYSRLVDARGEEGDVLIAISTSGRSENIIKAARKAREKNVVVVAFTGSDGGDLAPLSDMVLDIPSDDTPVIQEAHIMLGHIICQIVENNLFGK